MPTPPLPALALCPGRLDLAPVAFGFQVDLANSRRLKGRRRETRALIPLAVSQPIVPVHSAQCWGGPALLCPFRYRDGNGPSPWLLSVASLSWFSHPAHFMVNKRFMTPPAPPPTITPFEHTVICFPDPGRWKNCSKESSKYWGKYNPPALAAVPPLHNGKEGAWLCRRMAMDCENRWGLFPPVSSQGSRMDSFSVYRLTPLWPKRHLSYFRIAR